MVKLTKRKEVRIPTAAGWLCLALLALALVFFLFETIYPFLHLNERIDGDMLVVEGWIDDEALKRALEIDAEGDYKAVVAVGIPLTHGSDMLPYDNYAELTAVRLLGAGLASNRVITVAAPGVRRNRTREMALAVKGVLDGEDRAVDSVDLFTVGPHARRSRDIYRHVLEPEYAVGVIAIDPANYSADDWWRWSEGVKSVLSESVAYVYNMMFIFFSGSVMENLSVYLAGCLLGYLLGAIPFGFILGKIKGVDVRRVGSGNVGATNVFRTVGTGWGIAAFALDFLKGLIAAFCLPLLFEALLNMEQPYLLGLACGIAAVVGHNYSVYLKLQGGKGVATSAGMLAGVAPIPFACGIGAWLVVFLATRYVSLGSIVAAIAVGASVWVFNDSGGYTLPTLISAVSAFAIARHRSNMKRLYAGTETKVSFKKGEAK